MYHLKGNLFRVYEYRSTLMPLLWTDNDLYSIVPESYLFSLRKEWGQINNFRWFNKWMDRIRNSLNKYQLNVSVLRFIVWYNTYEFEVRTRTCLKKKSHENRTKFSKAKINLVSQSLSVTFRECNEVESKRKINYLPMTHCYV